MTEILLTALLVNTLAAALLGGLALLAWRRYRRPLIAHALVVVALLKLVTPPMWGPVVFESEPAASARDTAPRIVDVASLRELQTDAVASTEVASFLAGLDAWTLALSIWLLGSALAIVIMWRRHRRFTALLRRLDPAPRAVETLAAPLAHELGLRTTPLLRIADSAMQPFLFALGSAPTIVLPRAAVEELDQPSLRALLAHELAHLRNRDHWTRALELAVAAAHWWNPLAHLLRGLLREVEEVRCDARAVAVLRDSPDRLGPKRYGRALLDATELLEARAKQLGQTSFGTPLGATALSDAGTLRRRITALATGALPCRLGSLSRTSLLVAAGSTLPFGLMGAAPQPEVLEESDERIVVLALEGDDPDRPHARILRWDEATDGNARVESGDVALPELLAKLGVSSNDGLRALGQRRLRVERADGSRVFDTSDVRGRELHVVVPQGMLDLGALTGLRELSGLQELENLTVDLDVDVDHLAGQFGDRLGNALVKVAVAVPTADDFAVLVGDALSDEFEDVELRFGAEPGTADSEAPAQANVFRIRSAIRRSARAGDVRSY